MMKKILKGIALAVVIYVLSAVIAIIPINPGKNLHEGIGDNNDSSGIIDDANLFDKSELKKINKLIRKTSDETKLNITVLLSNRHMSDSQTTAFSHNLYDSTYGEYTDGVLLYLDLAGYSTATDFISLSGKAHIMYQKYVDAFLKAMYVHLPSSGEKIYSEDVSLAIETFCDKLVDYNKSFEPYIFDYEYDSNAGTYTYFRGDKLYITTKKAPGSRLKVMLAGSFIGTVLAIIMYFSIKRNYKFKSAANPSVYVSHDETHFNEKSDTYIRSYTTKHRIQSSSGGSSRSGGGGGSFGGSHGGGIGHR